MKQYKYIGFAFLAALLYALNAPFSKLLLDRIPETMMAGLLYLGAGIGMYMFGLFQKRGRGVVEERLGKKEIPYAIGMIILDISALIFMMTGLKQTSAENGSLLNNFEIVATAVFARFLFQEKINPYLFIGIGLIFVASLLLSIDNITEFTFSFGSLFVLVACICWGLENNFTRKMSMKDPLQIVVLKGLASGLGALGIAFLADDLVFDPLYLALAILLGFLSYGLSIFFYVYAQRHLGASKTSSYYAAAPFIGVIVALLLFQEVPSWTFFIALAVMVAGTVFVTLDELKTQK